MLAIFQVDFHMVFTIKEECRQYFKIFGNISRFFDNISRFFATFQDFLAIFHNFWQYFKIFWQYFKILVLQYFKPDTGPKSLIQHCVVGGVVVCKPLLVLCLGFGQAEQYMAQQKSASLETWKLL